MGMLESWGQGRVQKIKDSNILIKFFLTFVPHQLVKLHLKCDVGAGWTESKIGNPPRIDYGTTYGP